MSKSRNAAWLLAGAAWLALAGAGHAQTPAPAAPQQAHAHKGANYPGLGRTATPKEVAAWDIDVRPDFKGLPAGAGSVARGQEVWEGKCAHCHGVFGESNEVFSPLIGGTTAQDVQTGRVANLARTDYHSRSTIMKVATLSTLWDYINRAMPWNNPKTLSVEEVYGVTAYMLNLAHVVPDDFVLSDKNVGEVQKRMPNRNGMSTAHAMWPGKELGGTARPDTRNTLCMRDCAPAPKVTSALPDFARNAHGNLAEQNRSVGPQKGADTTRPEAQAPSAAAPSRAAPAPAVPSAPPAAPPAALAAPSKPAADSKAALALLNKHSCTACHAVSKKLLGPSFQDIAKKHAGKVAYLQDKIKTGGAGVWGSIPMPAQAIGPADALQLAHWMASGAGQ